MILNPYFWLALVGICIGCYVAGCAQERKEVIKVQAAWEAERKEIKDNELRIAAERKEADAKAASDAAQATAARNANFADLEKRHSAMAAGLNACNRDRGLLVSLRDTVDAANAAIARPASATPASATATPAATGIDQWFVSVAKLYDDCTAEVIDWQGWYKGLKEAR